MTDGHIDMMTNQRINMVDMMDMMDMVDMMDMMDLMDLMDLMDRCTLDVHLMTLSPCMFHRSVGKA